MTMKRKSVLVLLILAFFFAMMPFGDVRARLYNGNSSLAMDDDKMMEQCFWMKPIFERHCLQYYRTDDGLVSFPFVKSFEIVACLSILILTSSIGILHKIDELRKKTRPIWPNKRIMTRSNSIRFSLLVTCLLVQQFQTPVMTANSTLSVRSMEKIDLSDNQKVTLVCALLILMVMTPKKRTRKEFTLISCMLVMLLISRGVLSADLNELSWRWVRGLSSTNENGVCGDIGQYSASYTPGSRWLATMTVATSSGVSYLFGGEGYSAAEIGKGNLGDMWAYRQTDWSSRGEWAWLGGRSGSINYQGYYEAPTPYPGARQGSVAWYYDDLVYVHAGHGIDGLDNAAGSLSDLWSFNSTSFEWNWLRGSSNRLAVYVATYGTKGAASPDNVPGAVKRHRVLTVKSDGCALLFGGSGFDTETTSGYLSDTWEYDKSSNQWTWLNGPSLITRNSQCGNSGDFLDSYYPGGRAVSAIMDTTRKGGGYGYLGDLWAYNVDTNQWAYIAGTSNGINSGTVASFETLSTFSAGGHPGGRQNAGQWSDPNSDLIHLFGGRGYDESGSEGKLNDFWSFNVSTEQWAWAGGDSVKNQDGDYEDNVWFSTSNKPGGRHGQSFSVNYDIGAMYLFGGQSPSSSVYFNDFWVTRGPTVVVGVSPTNTPSSSPTPSASPTTSPTTTPSASPTTSPTTSPSASPTTSPSASPSASPTPSPSPSPPPVLLSLDPPYGPTSGSTYLKIQGDELHLLGSTSVTVRFESGAEMYQVSGTRIGLREIRCLTPPFSTAANVSVTVIGAWSTLVCAQQFNYYSNLTLSSVVPNLALRTGGQSIRIYGSDIPDTGSYFTVRLTDADGNNVTTTATSFSHGNTTFFTAPSFAAYHNSSLTTYPVQIDVAPNGQQYFEGQSLAFKYYVLPTLESVNPSQVQTHGGMNVTVKGSGFFPSDFIQCSFGGDVGPGFYLSTTVVKCLVPKVDNGGVKQLQVSMDAGNVYTQNDVKIVMVEFVSDECRRKEEVTVFVQDREQLGLYYFPNLAVGATVITSSRRDDYDSSVGRSLDPSQIVDGDRCCEYNIETRGYKCGVVLSTAQSQTELASVTVDLGYEAYVDEVLSTWYRPCKNLPDPGYTIETRINVTAAWVKLLERSVWKENPCRTLTGDNGPTAFCADFFQPIVARQFRLTFNNSVDHFLVGDRTDGGWLDEFEVHGIFLKTPYRLYTASPPLSVRSGITVPIPPIVVESLSILDGPMNASDPDIARTVSLNLPYMSPHAATQVQGSHNFSDIALARPRVGTYSLVFACSGLVSTNVTILVTQGSAAYIGFTSASVTYPSAAVVELNPVTVKAYDEGHNFCDADLLHRNITVKCDSLVLTGVLWSNMSNGQAVFNSLSMMKPSIGVHSFVFEADGLRCGVLNVSVGVGLPYQLSLDAQTIDPKPSAHHVNIPTLIIRILDAGGARVVSATDQVDVTLVGAVPTLLGNTSVYAENGMAVFSGLQLASPPAGTYQLKFTSLTLPQSPLLTATVTVVPGPATSIFVQNYTSSVYGSAVFTKLEPITLGALDAGGNRVSATGTLFVSLHPGSHMLAGTTLVNMIDGNATVSNLTILSPASGSYRLNFTQVGVTGASLEVFIIPGAAVSLTITQGLNQTLLSCDYTLLHPIHLQAVDAGRSFAPAVGNVTVSCDSCTLSGPLTQGLLPNGTLIMPGLIMLYPKAGRYTLRFDSALRSTTSTVYIEVGLPHRLVVDTASLGQCNPDCTDDNLCCRSASTTSLPDIVVRAVDAGGDLVGTQHPSFSSVITATFLNSSLQWWSVNSTSVSMKDGFVTFWSIRLAAPSTGSYVMRFAGTGLISTYMAIRVKVGAPAGIVILSGPTATHYPCIANTVLDNVQVQLIDAGGTSISTLESATDRNVRLAVRSSSDVILKSEVTAPASTVTGVALFTGIDIGSPKVGRIIVQMSATFMEGKVEFNATVVRGPPVAFRSAIASKENLKGASLVHVHDITVTELDAGSNVATPTFDRDVTVTLPSVPGVLTGTVNTTTVNGSVVLNDLWLYQAEIGLYALHIAVEGLGYTSVSVTVESGIPARIKLEAPENGKLPVESDNINPLSPIIASIVDGAGNLISTAASIQVRVLDGIIANRTVAYVAGPTLINAKKATFDNVKLEGRRGSTFTVLFFMVGREDVNRSLSIGIESCSAQMKGSVVTDDGEDCWCPAGRTAGGGECIDCPSGTYKGSPGPHGCTNCVLQPAKSRAGTASALYCKCDAGSYYNSVSKSCENCLSSANCPGGPLDVPNDSSQPETIGPILPKPGYWRSDSSNYPWDIMACPSGSNACGGGINSTACRAPYNGVLCSRCIDGFAIQVTVCSKCADQGINLVVFIVAIVAVLFLGQYYVRKQMIGGQSAEATILKVIINFCQVLAFIGGFRARWAALMNVLFVYLGGLVNMDALGIQPIQCLLNTNYYGTFALFAFLTVLCFIIPLIFYSLGHVSILQASVALIKRALCSRSLHDRKRSTRASTWQIIIWPFKVIVLVAIPAAASGIASGFRACGGIIGPRLSSLWDRLAGETLDGSDEAHKQEVEELPAGSVTKVADPMENRSPMSRAKAAFWILFLLLLPSIVKNTLELFNCRLVGSIQLIDSDLSIECNTTTHFALQMIFWIVVVPMILTLLGYLIFKNGIVRKRRDLVRYLPAYNKCEIIDGNLKIPADVDSDSASVLRKEMHLLRRLRKYVFLFSGYRTDGLLYLWDLVIMTRKIAIAAILVFWRDELVLQIFFALLVFVLSLVLHLKFQPFDDDYARRAKMRVLPSTLEFMSILATIFTLLCGLLFYFEGVLSDLGRLILDYFLLVANVVVITIFVLLLIDAIRLRLSISGHDWLYGRDAQMAAKWWKLHYKSREDEGIEMSHRSRAEDVHQMTRSRRDEPAPPQPSSIAPPPLPYSRGGGRV